MKFMEDCLQFYLEHNAMIWFIITILTNMGWVVMWFAKTRRYWLEGTEVKKRIKKMEIDEWISRQVDLLYKAVIEHYKSIKSVGRLKIDQEEIRRTFFKEPSLTDETIISGCWKKILDNRNAILDDMGHFYFVR